MMLTAAYGLMTTVGAAATGALSAMCLKERLYTSVNNNIETDLLMEELHRRQGSLLGLYERSVKKGRWMPTVVLTPAYCASVKINTSQHDITQQSIEASVWIPCCASWDIFTEKRLRFKGETDDGDVDAAPGALPEQLPHVVIRDPYIMYPSWKVKKQLVFAPDTPEEELVLADALADRALATLQGKRTSGIFVVNGPPKTGKTSAGMRLAQKLGPRTLLVNTFRPTQAGHMLDMMEYVRDEYSSEEDYIVILLNEFDTWMNDFADGKGGSLSKQGSSLTKHPKLITEVTDKDTWNTWSETVLKRSRVVIWMTTNSDLRGYDESLLRSDRISARYCMLDAERFDVVFEPKTEAKAAVKVQVQVQPDALQSDQSDCSECSGLTAPLLQAACRG